MQLTSSLAKCNCLNFGICDFFGIWRLSFGAFPGAFETISMKNRNPSVTCCVLGALGTRAMKKCQIYQNVIALFPPQYYNKCHVDETQRLVLIRQPTEK